MLELLSQPATYVSLLTLTALEVVLGIDNVVFLSIMAAKVPREQQPRVRRLGLTLALLLRILLLLGIYVGNQRWSRVPTGLRGENPATRTIGRGV